MVARNRANARADQFRKRTHRLGASRDDSDVGAHACCDFGCASPHDTATENDDPGGRDIIDCAEQDATSALRALEEMRRDLRRHAPRHLRHRREQRQPPRRVGYGLVGDGGDPGCQEVPRLHKVRGQMQISEEHLTTPQLLAFGRKRFLNLHDQVGAFEYFIGGCDDPGAGCGIFVIADAGAIPGEGFDVDAVASGDQFPDGRGNEPNAIFVSFDFFRNGDEHGCSQLLVRIIRSHPRQDIWHSGRHANRPFARY